MRIPPLKIKILLESNPLKSRILVRRLAVRALTRIHRHSRLGLMGLIFFFGRRSHGIIAAVAWRKLEKWAHDLFAARAPWKIIRPKARLGIHALMRRCPVSRPLRGPFEAPSGPPRGHPLGPLSGPLACTPGTARSHHRGLASRSQVACFTFREGPHREKLFGFPFGEW